MCSSGRGNTEGNNSSTENVYYFDVWCLWMCCVSCLHIVTGFVDWLGKWFIWDEFWNVNRLMTESDCPEGTLCDWLDVKIQLLTNSFQALPQCTLSLRCLKSLSKKTTLGQACHQAAGKRRLLAAPHLNNSAIAQRQEGWPVTMMYKFLDNPTPPRDSTTRPLSIALAA